MHSEHQNTLGSTCTGEGESARDHMEEEDAICKVNDQWKDENEVNFEAEWI